ncbi:hypothetical protein MG599_23915 (plasmid) [Paenarthrobacter sp. SD-1]|uniref:Uncharacterized protein n=1 Tax=Paenarthrobacter ureafaciens TaxID=37931 RepID=A0AAX3ERH7_PAEUR|nr:MULTISPECIES: hypothetical protein [Paenarthrobacter]MDO5878317.1 hypothetical protein [Paenarthrobacter sp. SD-1]UYW00233.1 hypothetical protein NL394_23860 [Paenarthrobacter ureafaciens]
MFLEKKRVKFFGGVVVEESGVPGGTGKQAQPFVGDVQGKRNGQKSMCKRLAVGVGFWALEGGL